MSAAWFSSAHAGKAHRRPCHRFADPGGVGRVILLLFKQYSAPNNKTDIRKKEYTFSLPYLAPAVDNTSYVSVPIPYFIYSYAEIYFAAVISGDPLKELVKVPFRLTISWDRPSEREPTIFIVTATARNMQASSPVAGEQIEDKNGKMRAAPKVMAEITFDVEQIAP
jgi:hypothetical protein